MSFEKAVHRIEELLPSENVVYWRTLLEAMNYLPTASRKFSRIVEAADIEELHDLLAEIRYILVFVGLNFHVEVEPLGKKGPDIKIARNDHDALVEIKRFRKVNPGPLKFSPSMTTIPTYGNISRDTKELSMPCPLVGSSTTMKLTQSVLLLGCLLILITGCSSELTAISTSPGPPAQDATRISTDPSPPLATSTPTPRELGTAGTSSSPDAQEITSTPTLPSWMSSDFLFGRSSPDCQLPCWNGLIVGESSADKVQAFFDEELGFNRTQDFTEEPSDDALYTRLYGVDHLDVNGYRWVLRTPPGYERERLDLLVWLDEETAILRGSMFLWNARLENDLDQHLTPGIILRQLGTPDYVFVTFYETIDTTQGVMSLLMIYNWGFSYRGDVNVPISWSADSLTFEFCLGGEQWGGSFNAGPRQITITEPLPGDIHHLSPLQERLFGDSLDVEGFRYLDDFFDLTPSQLAESTAQDQSSCFTSIDLVYSH